MLSPFLQPWVLPQWLCSPAGSLHLVGRVNTGLQTKRERVSFYLCVHMQISQQDSHRPRLGLVPTSGQVSEFKGCGQPGPHAHPCGL